MNANTDRIAWVDVFKFLGIWAIYIGHFGDKGGKLYPFVFAYHVPMFFFAAGFFAIRSLRDAPLPFLKKKTLQLMVPYAFFGAFALIVFTLLNDWGILEAKDAAWSLALGIRNHIFAGSLWFIPCLYLMIVLDYFLRKVLKSALLVLAVALGMFVIAQLFLPHTPSWFMNLDSVSFYYIYFALGAVLFPYLIRDNSTLTQRVTSWVLLAIAAIVTALTYFQSSAWLFGKMAGVLPILSTLQLAAPLYDVLIALTIIYVNIWVATVCSQITFLGELGRETLIFCGTEDVTKNALAEAFTIFSLKLRLISPLATVIFSLICLLVSKYTFVHFFNTYFPWAVGKADLPSRAQHIPTAG